MRGICAAGERVTFIAGDRGVPEIAPGVEIVALGGDRLLEAGIRRAALSGLYNRTAGGHVRRWIAEHDTPGTVYHLHNWALIFSPAIFDALAAVADRCVIHCHDFFLACPNGSFHDYPRGRSCARVPLSVGCVATQCDKRSYSHKVWRLARQHVVRHKLGPFLEASQFVIVYEPMRPWLARSISPRRLVAVGNPVEAFGPIVPAPEQQRHLVFIGQMQRYKGIFDIAEAGRRLGLGIDFFGEGDARAALTAAYPEHRCHGWQSRAAIARHLRAARASIVATHGLETFCLSAFETLATGLPLVVSDAILAADPLVATGGAVSFPAGDVVALTGVLQRLVADDAAIARMAEAARAHGPRLAQSVDAWVGELRGLYAERLADRRDRGAMRIVIFNCKYSENLGDGLIAETLEATLRALRPGVDVHTCDLAGRTDYGQATMPSRSRALSVLSRLPQAARRQAVATVLGRRLPELREAWRARLRGADLAIFGGGQLFQDGDLNFPMKLGAAFELCADVKVPVAIHAVGVSREWSRRGTALFHRLLATDCLSVSVRDRNSQLSWAGHFRGTRLAQALVVPDPVLAMLVKPPEPGSAVGLNVTDPLLLRYHSGSRTQAGEIASMLRNVVRHVTARGREVVLFTNGASEDEAFLDQIVDGSPASEVRRAPRPRVPADTRCHPRRGGRRDRAPTSRQHSGLSARIALRGARLGSKARELLRRDRQERLLRTPHRDGGAAHRLGPRGIHRRGRGRPLPRRACERCFPRRRGPAAPVRRARGRVTRRHMSRIRAGVDRRSTASASASRFPRRRPLRST